MAASSNFTLNHPVNPVGGNSRASSNFTIGNPTYPVVGSSRASASFSLLVDFNTDGENTLEFTQDAAAMIMTPMDIFADAGVNVQFDTPAGRQIVAHPFAENIIELDTSAQEQAIFGAASMSTIELDINANVSITADAATTIELDVEAFYPNAIPVGAASIIELDVEAFHPNTISVGAASTLSLSNSAAFPPMLTTCDVIVYGSENHQKDNISGPQGGAIELTRKITTGPIPFLSTVSFSSSKQADTTQVYRVEGLGPTRAIESETIILNGAELVSTEKVFTRLCTVRKVGGLPLVGDVTVSTGTAIIGTMDSVTNSNAATETEELYNLLANTMGRATVDTAFYEKFFIRNNTENTIFRMSVSEHQSDFKDRVLFAADPNYNHTSTSRNRLTKPGDPNPGDFLTDDELVFDNIPVGSSVGIWLRLLIPAGESTVLNGWKVKIVTDGATKILDLLHPEGSGLAFANVLSKRTLHPIGGGNPLRYIERSGAKFVKQIYYEPDPTTFRDKFYYNVRLNRLFKKLDTKPVPVWKAVR